MIQRFKFPHLYLVSYLITWHVAELGQIRQGDHRWPSGSPLLSPETETYLGRLSWGRTHRVWIHGVLLPYADARTGCGFMTSYFPTRTHAQGVDPGRLTSLCLADARTGCGSRTSYFPTPCGLTHKVWIQDVLLPYTLRTHTQGVDPGHLTSLCLADARTGCGFMTSYFPTRWGRTHRVWIHDI